MCVSSLGDHWVWRRILLLCQSKRWHPPDDHGKHFHIKQNYNCTYCHEHSLQDNVHRIHFEYFSKMKQHAETWTGSCFFPFRWFCFKRVATTWQIYAVHHPELLVPRRPKHLVPNFHSSWSIKVTRKWLFLQRNLAAICWKLRSMRAKPTSRQSCFCSLRSYVLSKNPEGVFLLPNLLFLFSDIQPASQLSQLNKKSPRPQCTTGHRFAFPSMSGFHPSNFDRCTAMFRFQARPL